MSDRAVDAAQKLAVSVKNPNVSGSDVGAGHGMRWLDHAYTLRIIVLVGLLLRLALLFFTRHSPVFADELDYRDIGFEIVQKHHIFLNGSPTAFRPVGEPLFIAMVSAIFGPHVMAVKLLQEACLTALPLLAFRLATTLGLSRQNGNFAALLVAFNPALAYAASTLYPTALTAVLLTTGVVLAGSAARRHSLCEGCLSAVYLGCAGLFTTTFMPLPALIGVCFLWKRQLRLAIVFCILGSLPAAVWVIRNRLILHTWTVATNGGMNLYLGANDEATPRSGNWILEPPTVGGELVRDRVLGARGEKWISSHRVRWAKLWLARSLLVVDSVGKPKTAGYHSSLAPRLIGWLMFPLIIAGLIGLFFYRRSPEIIFTSLALVLVVVSSATTIVKPRFRFPCDPLLTVTAVAALAVLTRTKHKVNQGLTAKETSL